MYAVGRIIRVHPLVIEVIEPVRAISAEVHAAGVPALGGLAAHIATIFPATAGAARIGYAIVRAVIAERAGGALAVLAAGFVILVSVTGAVTAVTAVGARVTLWGSGHTGTWVDAVDGCI